MRLLRLESQPRNDGQIKTQLRLQFIGRNAIFGRQYRSANIMTTEFPKGPIEALCRKHHITRLSLFGSVLHQDSSAESDVDILVEFEEGHTPGFAFAGIQRELSEMLGREVDLHTPASLSRYFRTDVVKEARPLYATSLLPCEVNE